MTLIIGDPRKGKYDPDLARRLNEQEARKKSRLERKADGLDYVCEAYEKFLQTEEFVDGDDWPNTEKIVGELFSGRKVTRSQIENFCQVLPQYKDSEGIGFAIGACDYLNRLIGLSKDKEFILDLREGVKAGVELEDELEPPEEPVSQVTLYGDVGECFGDLSKNCEFILHGDAGVAVGDEAENTIIELYGSYEDISNRVRKGTEIYHIIGEAKSKIHPK